jgi:hypothetical protein
MRGLVVVLLALATPVVAVAQMPADMMAKMAANPVAETTRMMFAEHAHSMVAAADSMPADKYGFSPTPAQMTFGKLIAHIAQTNQFICGALAGTPMAPPAAGADLPAKDVLVKSLKDSFDQCGGVLASLTDAQMAQTIDVRGQKLPRAYLVLTLVTDWADHYSTEASYLRGNGILPPTARQPGN